METPTEFALRTNMSVSRVRLMIRQRQIQHVKIGARKKIPPGAYERFLADNTVEPCPEEITALASNGSRNGAAFTSSGQKMAAAASGRRVQMIAKALKRSSANSFKPGKDEPAPES